MKHSVGCDIVYIPSFARSVQEGGSEFLKNLFSESEINLASSLESLAGFFAIKESVIKAIGRKINWLDIIIYKLESGKPAVRLPLVYSLCDCDVSVAHHGEYSIAIAMISQQPQQH
jgi:phosphopantetheine--protein transferase-like protein